MKYTKQLQSRLNEKATGMKPTKERNFLWWIVQRSVMNLGWIGLVPLLILVLWCSIVLVMKIFGVGDPHFADSLGTQAFNLLATYPGHVCVDLFIAATFPTMFQNQRGR